MSANGGHESQQPGQRRVLVADGDRAIVETISLILDRQGYWVDMETDGNEALRKVTEGEYDVVIVDVHLPSRRGFPICERVRARDRMCGRYTHIVLMTSGDNPEHVFLAKIRGVTTVLSKPFRMGELRRAMEAGLGRPPAK